MVRTTAESLLRHTGIEPASLLVQMVMSIGLFASPTPLSLEWISWATSHPPQQPGFSQTPSEATTLLSSRSAKVTLVTGVKVVRKGPKYECSNMRGWVLFVRQRNKSGYIGASRGRHFQAIDFARIVFVSISTAFVFRVRGSHFPPVLDLYV